jgi:hypothetical protein
MSCKECIYWNQESSPTGFGKCRRFPPSGVVIPALYPEGKWTFPITHSQDWCGEERKNSPELQDVSKWGYDNYR